MREIGVVVTSYGLGRTLPEALASVRAQTRSAAELVVVDDGSEDVLTLQALARAEHAGVRVVRAAHRGLSAARNLGARLTTAEYLVFLDADDTFEPTYFEQAGRRLDQERNLDFVSCAVRGFGALSYEWKPPAPSIVNCLTGNTIHVSSVMRRSLWERVGGFDETLPFYEEVDFWLSALERNGRGEVLEQPLLNYRCRAGSLSRRALRRDRHVEVMARIYLKHRVTVEAQCLDLLVAKEVFLHGQRAHERHLDGRRLELERELEALTAERDQLTTSLQSEAGLGTIDWGELRRLEPLSRLWGLERGRPLDRHYIEGFLAAHRADIRGRVLEVKDPGYSRWFGSGEVTHQDVLDIDATNPQATIVADLQRAETIPADTFDCFILTQTLHVLYDVGAALEQSRRILKPGGVLLCTVPALSRISYEDRGLDGDYWRFTEASLRELFGKHFAPEEFEVVGFGNVLTCTAFLYGLAPAELENSELERHDPFFPLLYGIRAVKKKTQGRVERSYRPQQPAVQPGRGVILGYHRIADPHEHGDGLAIGPDEFRRQLAELRAEYRPLPLRALVAGASAGTLPHRAVAVTFDDGYLDTWTAAVPLLREFGIPATVFLTSCDLERKHEYWWDVLDRIFLGPSELPSALELAALPGRVLPTATAAERRSVRDVLQAFCFSAQLAERERLLDEIVAWSELDLSPRESHRALMAAEIARLAAVPEITIGCHTVHHLALPLQPVETAQREIAESRAAIEDLVARPVSAFAYPYGEADPSTARAVRDAGLHAAVTVRPAPVVAGSDPWLLPRYEVRAGDASLFAQQLPRVFLGRA